VWQGPKPQAPKKKPLTDIKPLCVYPFGALSKLSVAIMWALLPGSRLYDSSTSSAAAGYNKHNSRLLLFFLHCSLAYLSIVWHSCTGPQLGNLLPFVALLQKLIKI